MSQHPERPSSRLGWTAAAKRTWEKSNEDDVFGRSAQLAYYFFLALFPMLIFLISTVGVHPGAASHLREALFNFLTQVMPPSASELVEKTMDEISTSSGLGKLSFGLVFTLWSASAGMLAIMDTLNAEHGVEEDRSFVKQRVIAVGLTLAVAALLVGAASVIVLGHHHGIGAAFTGTSASVWKFAQWPVAFACILLSLELIYYFAPDLKHPHWHWITPGALVGCALWLIASVALRLYLHYFNSYSATYGSLGAVIILLISFYLTGIAILVGGEVNVVIDEAAGHNNESTHAESSIISTSSAAPDAPAV